jgi:hypothetical protein
VEVELKIILMKLLKEHTKSTSKTPPSYGVLGGP